MTEVEAFVASFGQAQLAQVLQNGAGIGLSPITTAATIMQIAATSLANIAQAETVAMLRAYADCIEAGPGDSAAKADAVARFGKASTAFVAIARASADFPAPQGRA
jgi:hypothetical protein